MCIRDSHFLGHFFQHDAQQDHPAHHGLLPGGGHAQDIHAVADEDDDQRAHHRVRHAALAALEGGAADQRRGDGVQGEAARDARVGRVELGHVQNARGGGQQAVDDIHAEDDVLAFTPDSAVAAMLLPAE